jgi:hypothetical protein
MFRFHSGSHLLMSSGFLVYGSFKKGRAFLQPLLVLCLKRLCVGGWPPAGLFSSPLRSKIRDALMKSAIPFQEKYFCAVAPNLVVE